MTASVNCSDATYRRPFEQECNNRLALAFSAFEIRFRTELCLLLMSAPAVIAAFMSRSTSDRGGRGQRNALPVAALRRPALGNLARSFDNLAEEVYRRRGEAINRRRALEQGYDISY